MILVEHGELLIGGGGPEIVPLVALPFLGDLAVRAYDRERTLPPEGRIGENYIEPVTGVSGQ